MAKSQDNSTTMLLGLKDCKAGEVVRGGDRIVVKRLQLMEAGRNVLIVARRNCMGMVCVTLATYCTPGRTAQRFI